MNDPMWDLADLSVEAGFGPEQDRTMVEAYRGAAASQTLYWRMEIYKAMSDLHWSLWGFVQHAKDNPAEDFWSYVEIFVPVHRRSSWRSDEYMPFGRCRVARAVVR